MEMYLQHHRPVLISEQRHDFLWIGGNGLPMADNGVSAMLRRRGLTRFGKALGPHIFRHSLATTAINELPQHPGLAASILGNSAAVVEKSYARADKIQAGLAYQATLSAQRAESADWAAELFARR